MEHKGTIRIETDRLVLKRHVLDDAEIMFKNWVTEKDVTKFLSWQPHKNVDETKQLLIDWIPIMFTRKARQKSKNKNNY